MWGNLRTCVAFAHIGIMPTLYTLRMYETEQQQPCCPMRTQINFRAPTVHLVNADTH
jgi:hypothetical protein